MNFEELSKDWNELRRGYTEIQEEYKKLETLLEELDESDGTESDCSITSSERNCAECSKKYEDFEIDEKPIDLIPEHFGEPSSSTETHQVIGEELPPIETTQNKEGDPDLKLKEALIKIQPNADQMILNVAIQNHRKCAEHYGTEDYTEEQYDAFLDMKVGIYRKQLLQKSLHDKIEEKKNKRLGVSAPSA